MMQFVQLDMDKHREQFIILNIEYLEYVAINFKEHHNIDLEKERGIPSIQYIHQSIDNLAYNPPDGLYYLIKYEDNFIGMGGFKRINKNIVEIKRMFIRPEARGKGIGKKLLQKILVKAKENNYSIARLASAKFMKEAHRLYKATGFSYIKPYQASEVEKFQKISVFMELKLN